jgi:hypothetical protein
MVDWNSMVEIGHSLIREKRPKRFPSTLINCSKRANFENRTESVESRASERNGPFGEQKAGTAERQSRAQIANGYGYEAQLPTSSPGEHTALGKLAERVGFELVLRRSRRLLSRNGRHVGPVVTHLDGPIG